MPPISQADYIAMLARTSKRAPVGSTEAVDDESELHRDIMAECKRRGWLAFHGSMAHKTRRSLGEPDVICLCDNGKLLLVEAKSKSGKLSTEQLGVHAWAEKLGHKIWVVRNMTEFLGACESV